MSCRDQKGKFISCYAKPGKQRAAKPSAAMFSVGDMLEVRSSGQPEFSGRYVVKYLERSGGFTSYVVMELSESRYSYELFPPNVNGGLWHGVQTTLDIDGDYDSFWAETVRKVR